MPRPWGPPAEGPGGAVARTVRASAAAVGPWAVRGPGGGMALGRGKGIKCGRFLLRYVEKIEVRQIPKNQGLTYDLPAVK